jgi:predicted DNA-binding transcriptional regulator AlpA
MYTKADRNVSHAIEATRRKAARKRPTLKAGKTAPTHTLASSIQYFDSLPNSADVRLPTVAVLYACSPATVWRGVKAGRIPAPRRRNPRCTTWNVGELRAARSV